MVGHGQLDGGPVVEVVLLRLVSIPLRLAGGKSQKRQNEQHKQLAHSDLVHETAPIEL
jgi:hypothetical protein